MQERQDRAAARLDQFSDAVSVLLRAREGQRYDVVYESTDGDVTVTGVLAEPGPHGTVPAGMQKRGNVLWGDPASATGLRFIDLAEQYSTSGLLSGGLDLGIPTRIRTTSGVLTPGLRYDPMTRSLYQLWPKRGGSKRAVKRCVEQSVITWLKVPHKDNHKARASSREKRKRWQVERSSNVSTAPEASTGIPTSTLRMI